VLVEQAVRGELPPDPRLSALCAFAVKLTREPAAVGREDVDVLRSHGLDDAAVHDAIQVIAYFNYINRVADAVGIEDEPEWATADPAPSRG
jgi:uncharacterized peroxidase-related enzyme